MEHIPTAMTPLETEFLRGFCKGRVVLELGALFGYSTLVMAYSAEKVYSVDPGEGYPADNPRPTWAEYMHNIKGSKFRNIVPIVGRWQDVITLFKPKSFDISFIDLTGEYEDTKRAIMACKLLTREHIVVHDCGHHEWTGVKTAVEELSRQAPYYVDTLGVMRL